MNKVVKQWLVAAVAGISLVIAACGGGGSGGSATGSSAASTQEVSSGNITGFGSVIVEGVKYDDSAVKVSFEIDSSAPIAAAVSDLRLGMKVEVASPDGSSADTIVVSAEVIGRITSLASDGFVVAAQTIKVSTDPAAPTVFEGVSGLSDLAVNDLVEVHGTRDSANNIIASRIERKDPNSPVAVRVVGLIAGLDTTAKTFTIGGLTVTYTGSTRIVPQGVTLTNGLRVAVWSDVAPTGTTLAAKAIVVKRGGFIDNDKARIGGFVRDLDFAAKTFKVDGFSVDATSATYVNGTANDLANARRVRVRGTFANGTLSATEVAFVRNQGDAAVDLTGAITDFVSSASFKVRGVPIDASAAGVVFVNGDATNLANGVAVHLMGTVNSNIVTATSLTFVTTPDDKVRNFLGIVRSYDSTAGTFNLFNLDMKLTDATTFHNADRSVAQRSDFGNTDRVQVRGVFQSGLFVVSDVVFRPGPSVVITSVDGVAFDVDATAGVFKIDGTIVKLDGTTVFNLTRDNLHNGTHVVVQGTVVNGQLVAGSVEIILADGSTNATVRGDIDAFVSTANFRVDDQLVDASGAQVSGGNLGDLVAGVTVEATGPVVNGVLTAVRITIVK
jgi:Domain of unknown function (DUF5666)